MGQGSWFMAAGRAANGAKNHAKMSCDLASNGPPTTQDLGPASGSWLRFVVCNGQRQQADRYSPELRSR